MKPRTALVVCGGGFQGLGLIKALRAVSGTRVLVMDTFTENVARYFSDACFPAPPLSQADVFIEFTLKICSRESVNDVFAATSLELEVLDKYRVSFEQQGVVLHISNSYILKLASNKLAFYQWLVSENLNCLPFFPRADASTAVYPLIGKPLNGWGGRNFQYINNLHEALALQYDERASYVWQPLLSDFDEYSVDCAINPSGQLSALSFRRRVRTLGGFAILGEAGAPRNVRDLAQTCLEHLLPLGTRGPINLQLLCKGSDCWVSDLNPRAGTSMPLSLVAGHNPIAFLLGRADAAKQLEPPTGSRARSIRYLEERHVPDLRLDNVRGVVFDLDDTLFDQKAWMLSKLEILWRDANIRTPSRDQFLSLAWQIIEEGNRAHLFDALSRELGWSEVERLDMIERYRSACPINAPLYPDVLASLQQLRHLGYRLALLTDNPPVSQRQKLEVSQLAACFDAVVLTGELGVSKPDPICFAACSAALKLTAQELVMVGDNLFRDINGAHNAGYKHGFLVRRSGAFFNFNPLLGQVAGLDLKMCTSIHSLSELFPHLPGMDLPETLRSTPLTNENGGK